MDQEPVGLDLSLDDLIKQSRPVREPRHLHRRHDDRFSGSSRRAGRRTQRGGGGADGRKQIGQRRDFRSNARRYPRRSPRPPSAIVDETGTVVVSTGDGKEIIRVTPQGDITIDTGNKRDKRTFQILNEALNPIDIRITKVTDRFDEDNWSISDGKTLRRFEDGIVIPGKLHFSRAGTVFQVVKSLGDQNDFFHSPRPPPPPGTHASSSVFSRLAK